MNKYKKMATAVISIVMAGSMSVSFVACGGGSTTTGSINERTWTADSDTAWSDSFTESLNYSAAHDQKDETTPSTTNGALSYTSNTSLTIAIGYNNSDTGVSYSNGNITTLGATTYLAGSIQTENSLKPAWSYLKSQLGVTFNDVYDGSTAGSNLSTLKTSTTNNLNNVNIFTASASTINTEGTTNATLLDISQYLDYMPNYKAFLESNPVVWASLIANASTGAMYMLPYFDGNNDIEKYVLMRKDIVETLLNGVSGETLSTTTFKEQADAKNNATSKPVKDIVGTSSSITSFMGTTGSWEIDVTDPSKLTGTASFGNDLTEVSDASATVKVTVNYDKALASAKSTSSGIGKILLDVEGVKESDVTGQVSGNIVDIMNVAIDKSEGAVTGGQLLQILREYIDVAYLDASGNSFYVSGNGLTRASVFNSASAAWDGDLYAALGRVFVTCTSMLGDAVKNKAYTYLIAGRAYTTQRTTDVASLAGELYGARGLESRYNYSYVGEDGEIQDARNNAGFYEAVEMMNGYALEGLFNTSDNVTADWGSVNNTSNTGIQTLSLHDYVQTQTAKYGFEDDDDYNFAPILTPVSVWNVDGDADTSLDGRSDGKETIMRFTESWRGVKDGGLAVSYSSVKGKSNELAAVLKFIDYCYSNDGQMVMTYGSQTTTGDGSNASDSSVNGTWYATAYNGTLGGVTVTNGEADLTSLKNAGVIATYDNSQYYVTSAYQDQVFAFGNKLYVGTYYNGRQIPTMTAQSYAIFGSKSARNFTNYARQLLGTTLPCFNKDQGFEYQCTAECGKAGAAIVNIALNNGTIKHQYQTLDGTDDSGNAIAKVSGTGNSYWYTLVPTQMPYDTTTTTAINSDPLCAISGAGSSGANLYINSSSTTRNLLLDLMYSGYDTTLTLSYYTAFSYNMPSGSAALVSLHNESFNLNTLYRYKRIAWHDLLTWYGEVGTAAA